MTHSGPVYSGNPSPRGPMNRSIEFAKAGVSFGSALAIVISWSVNHSILWAIVQGFFGWFYVAYYALTR